MFSYLNINKMTEIKEKEIKEFLNEIQFKFNILFKHDSLHKNLIVKVLSEYKLNTFIHIVEVCIAKISNNKCKTCSKTRIEKSISYISMYGKHVALFFSSYFNSNLKNTLELFSKFKCAIFTNDGMHLFDHMTSTLAYIKWINKTEKEETPNFEETWFGGLYFNGEPLEAFQSNINYINSKQSYKKIAYYGLLGTTLKPIHFFSIFIDKTISTLFIYNSYPIDINDYKLKKKLGKFKFIHNKYQNQFNNELCGFFSLFFIEKMIKSKNTLECFKSFNQNKNMDKTIEKYQETCVYPVRINYKLIDFFLADWNK